MLFPQCKRRKTLLMVLVSALFLFPVATACSAPAQSTVGTTPTATTHNHAGPSTSDQQSDTLSLQAKGSILFDAKWSDKATWGGTLPGAHGVVEIPKGKTILLDVNPPPLKSITINGTLVCAEQDLALSADWIMMLNGGKFQCGTEDAPFQHRATITLTGNNPAENVMGMGTKFLAVMSGTLDLHGTPRLSWTRLGATAPAGARQITLDKPVNWRVGDRIAIASTDYNPLQAEEATILAVSGATVTLDQPLKYVHWGQLQTFAGQTFDERAEVGLLSRNIIVQGDKTSSNGFGGQTMIMRGGVAHIENAEFYFMGQKQQAGRYPIHWHLTGDGNGSYAKNNSIHHSFNRCITLHGVHKVQLHSNVAFDNIGHCYFMEDGIETNNVLENNLGILTRKPAEKQEVILTDSRPATFWITNPNNILRGNVAAGSQGIGFWYALPEHPTGSSKNAANDQQIWPRHTPLGIFSNNVAHSNDDTGLHVDDGIKLNDTEPTYYKPRQKPAAESPAVVATFQNLTAYKNRQLAVWLRGQEHRLQGAKLADNGGGAVFASDESFIQDSVIVGETANKGTPEHWEKKGLDGRSLPQPWAADMPIMGYSFYDGKVGAQRVTFVNFVSNDLRPASGLSYLRSNNFPLNVLNFAQGLRFINANQVYLENPHTDKDGDKAAVFMDRDGSVTGKAGSYVAANNSFLATSACSFKKEWNTFICPTRYINFAVGNDSGGPAAPLTVSREDGVSTTLSGIPGYPQQVSLSLIPNRSYTVKFGETVPKKLRLYFNQVKTGDTVRVSVTYPYKPSQVYRNYDSYAALKPASNLADLEASTGDKYFYDGNTQTLHIKAVAQSGKDWTTVFADAS